MKKIAITVTIIIAIIIGFVIIFGLAIESKWEIKELVTINTTADKIFPYINKLPNWQEWTVWNTRDNPKMIFSYSEPPEGLNAFQEWVDDKKSRGKLIITKSDLNKSINYTLIMNNGYTKLYGDFIFNQENSKTKITWRIWGDAGGNPMAKTIMYFFKSMIRKDMARGFKRLKSLFEK